MNKNKKLKEFYTRKIEGKLLDYESLRKKALLSKRIEYVFFRLVLLSLFLGVISYRFLFVALFFMILGGLHLYLRGNNFHQYRSVFRTEIVSEIVNFTESNWKYYPGKYVSQEHYKNLPYLESCVQYTGEDFILGKIGKSSFQFSQIRTLGRSSQSRNVDRKLFNGFISLADCAYFFPATTYVFPKNYKSRYQEIEQKFKKEEKGELQEVQTENAEFEKFYTVKSTNPIGAKYIVTASIMDIMLAIQKKYNYQLNISLINFRLYITGENKKDLFESDLKEKGGVTYETLIRIMALLEFNKLVVNEINSSLEELAQLNQKIG